MSSVNQSRDEFWQHFSLQMENKLENNYVEQIRKKQQLAQQFRKGETDTFSTTAIFQKELIEFISG